MFSWMLFFSFKLPSLKASWWDREEEWDVNWNYIFKNYFLAVELLKQIFIDLMFHKSILTFFFRLALNIFFIKILKIDEIIFILKNHSFLSSWTSFHLLQIFAHFLNSSLDISAPDYTLKNLNNAMGFLMIQFSAS